VTLRLQVTGMKNPLTEETRVCSLTHCNIVQYCAMRCNTELTRRTMLGTISVSLRLRVFSWGSNTGIRCAVYVNVPLSFQTMFVCSSRSLQDRSSREQCRQCSAHRALKRLSRKQVQNQKHFPFPQHEET
jgi:hypothetical protein